MKHQVELFSINDTPHHCATIAYHPVLGIVIAGYCGAECTDEQHVFVKIGTHVLELESKTGNPVLWVHDRQIYMIYSRFQDVNAEGKKPIYPVDRWKFCSMFFCRVEINQSGIELVDVRELPECFGLLGRVNPIVVDGTILLPLYREEDPLSQIWEATPKGLVLRGSLPQTVEASTIPAPTYSRLGKGVAIQPSLYVYENKLYAICRNMTTNYDKAWLTRSNDQGRTWSPIKSCPLFNVNSSLVAINGTNLMIWNDQRKRTSLLLTNLENHRSVQLGVGGLDPLKASFSYPNYCWNGDELHIVHTNLSVIAHHIYDKNYLAYIFEPHVEANKKEIPASSKDASSGQTT